MVNSKGNLKEIFSQQIPMDNYTVSINVRDIDFGFTIRLKGLIYDVDIYWNIQLEVLSFRRDIGLRLLSNLKCFPKYQKTSFSNVIYEVENSSLIEDFEYRGFDKPGTCKAKHYVIVAENMICHVLSFDDIKISSRFKRGVVED